MTISMPLQPLEEELVPVFTSNERLAMLFQELPDEVAASCLLYFGCSRHDLFGLNGEQYDEFIRWKQRRRQVHLLKSTFWRPGQPCEFSEASAFFEQNGFQPLQTDMEFYKEKVSMENLLRESRRELPTSREGVLKKIEKNFADAKGSTGAYGHDIGTVLEMLHLSDDRLFPIHGTVGLEEFLERQGGRVFR
jgi:hypothetical protein